MGTYWYLLVNKAHSVCDRIFLVATRVEQVYYRRSLFMFKNQFEVYDRRIWPVLIGLPFVWLFSNTSSGWRATRAWRQQIALLTHRARPQNDLMPRLIITAGIPIAITL